MGQQEETIVNYLAGFLVLMPLLAIITGIAIWAIGVSQTCGGNRR